MTPPNLFRFVRVDKRILYNGYDLQEDESFDSSTWGITNYTAAGFSSQEDISFESGSLGAPDFAFNVVIQP